MIARSVVDVTGRRVPRTDGHGKDPAAAGVLLPCRNKAARTFKKL